jgi:hypothetical protein
VGFTDSIGLGKGKKGWPTLAATAMTTADIRRLFYQNTTNLTAALRDTLAEGPRGNTVHIVSDVLEKKIAQRRVELVRPVKVFAVKLMQTPFFKEFARGLLTRSQSI